MWIKSLLLLDIDVLSPHAVESVHHQELKEILTSMTAILRSARSTGTVLGETPTIKRRSGTMIPQPLIMLLFLGLTIPVVVLLVESILQCQK